MSGEKVKKKKKNSEKYWKRRSLEDSIRRIGLTEDYIRENLVVAYEDAKIEILEEIERFYEKYAHQNKITLAAAKRKIKKADFKGIDFEELAKLAAKNDDDELHDLLNALSKKGQISRLESLDMQIDTILSNLYAGEQQSMFGYLAETYADGYYRSIINVDTFSGIRTAFDILREDAIVNAVSQTWSKRHFSEAIWGHREKLSSELRDVVTKHLIKGSSMDRMSRDIRNRMDVGLSDAKRLARTETNYIHNKSTLDAYSGEAAIEKYKYLATLDFKTSETCQGLDGKIFDTRDAQVGKNYPPMHPNCRSTTTPHFEDEDYVGVRAARDENGKTYYVPADMKYKEWFDGLPEDVKAGMKLELKKAKNLTTDKKQFMKYKPAFKNSIDILDESGNIIKGKLAVPAKFSDFQKLKYGDKKIWDSYKDEYRSIRLDSKQHEKFKNIIPKEVPKTVVDFRNLKYNDSGGFENLKRSFEHEVKVRDFKRKLDAGGINLQVRRQKQQEHIRGTPQWKRRVCESLAKNEHLEGAFLKDIDIQKIVNSNAGKGLLKFKGNDKFPREYFDTKDNIGIAYNKDKNKYEKTNRVAVHYSSTGTHAYPVLLPKGK